MGAAKTGSGKTLAFLIPLLERLYRKKWGKGDGLGALVLTPSRELAVQIFEVLRTIGKHHAFSAGLLIGGVKNFKEEKELIGRMNILVATPGRLLQHLDETHDLRCENLEMLGKIFVTFITWLVLDEADCLLELGFKEKIADIVQSLPKERQTLLFSATQTKSVKDLAMLSLNVLYHCRTCNML